MKEIKLTQGKTTFVDDEDYEWLNSKKWCVSSDGYNLYAARSINKEPRKQTRVYMHREILNAPSVAHSDHIDGNGLNNQRSNLRACTMQENLFNKRKYRNGLSKFKGVCFHKVTGKWCAQIQRMGEYRYLGLFDTEQDAARAYNKKAIELFGEFARLNEENKEGGGETNR